MPNQNNSSNVLKTEPQLQPRPQTIQPVQHQQIGQPQIITVQDEKGNSVQTQQLIYQVKIFKKSKQKYIILKKSNISKYFLGCAFESSHSSGQSVCRISTASCPAATTSKPTTTATNHNRRFEWG